MKRKLSKLILVTLVSSAMFAERISIAVNPGEAYSNRAPQLAAWIEDSEGNFVDTLFVTKKASGNKWIGSPKNGRPEALPDWYRAKGQNPAVKIPKEELDATTRATPKKGIVIEKDLPLEKGKSYVFKCQANQSFDYNEYYTKKNSGVDGQPAVLYCGELVADGTEKEISLGFSGSRENLTTADKIIESIYIVVK